MYLQAAKCAALNGWRTIFHGNPVKLFASSTIADCRLRARTEHVLENVDWTGLIDVLHLHTLSNKRLCQNRRLMFVWWYGNRLFVSILIGSNAGSNSFFLMPPDNCTNNIILQCRVWSLGLECSYISCYCLCVWRGENICLISSQECYGITSVMQSCAFDDDEIWPCWIITYYAM